MDESKKNTSTTTASKSTKSPNSVKLIDPKKKILVANERNEAVETLASDYKVEEGSEGFVHISTVQYQETQKRGARREAVKKISVATFTNNSTVLGLCQTVEGGGVAFRLSDDTHEAGLQAYNILMACTEYTKDEEGNAVFTKEARELVAKRFNLFVDAEITRKCQELRVLNWGSGFNPYFNGS